MFIWIEGNNVNYVQILAGFKYKEKLTKII